MNLQNHRTWNFVRPLLTEAVELLLICSVLVGLASASDFGRPGSGYPGYLCFLGVLGVLLAYHRSAARRWVCFVALLFALVGLHSEKSAGEAWDHTKSRRYTDQIRRDYERILAENEKASVNQPAATP